MSADPAAAGSKPTSVLEPSLTGSKPTSALDPGLTGSESVGVQGLKNGYGGYGDQ
jgi:hypothetical protein